MRVAVLSLTRDRLPFTKHCFASLREFAGCDYDHHVWDNGSQDETAKWLGAELDAGRIASYTPSNAPNVGVSVAMNHLLDLVSPGRVRERGFATAYDVIVKFDNDCELTVPDTLKAACEVALEGWIASPHIMGLNSPPTVESETTVAGYRVGIPNLLGGIFMACPASWYEHYRHDESNPVWGMDDARIVEAWRASGGEAGYLLDYPANHYLTTVGQHEAFPGYFERRVGEGGPP